MVVYFEDHEEPIEVTTHETSELNTSLQEVAGHEADDSMAVRID